mgnify:CR=1 FL=1
MSLVERMTLGVGVAARLGSYLPGPFLTKVTQYLAILLGRQVVSLLDVNICRFWVYQL